jgi:hypothetical protein
MLNSRTRVGKGGDVNNVTFLLVPNTQRSQSKRVEERFPMREEWMAMYNTRLPLFPATFAAMLTILNAGNANAQYYRGNLYSRMPVMRPLPRPVMQPYFPYVRPYYHPSLGGPLRLQGAGTTPIRCDRFNCYVY